MFVAVVGLAVATLGCDTSACEECPIIIIIIIIIIVIAAMEIILTIIIINV